MNKKTFVVLGMTVVLTFSGCGLFTPTEDVYDKDESIVTENNNTTTEDVTAGDETSDTTGEETVAVDTSEEGQTVTEDVYQSETQSEVVIAEGLLVSDVAASSVDDPELKEKMLRFLDPFYFNIYFGLGDYSETGITETDMVKFAISYVYLYENQAHKFDTTTFKLYVPEERVEELVEKYFGMTLGGHHTIEDEGIEYNGGYYLMPASDVGWNEDMVIHSITKAGDFAYEVVFTIVDIEGKPTQSYKVILEVRGERFVLTYYGHTETPSADAEETEDESSEGESSSDSDSE